MTARPAATEDFPAIRALYAELAWGLENVSDDPALWEAVRASGTVEQDENGEATEIVGVFQDVTEQQRAEQDLRSTNETLERRMTELEMRSRMMGLMSDLGDMLQSALDLVEAQEVLRVLLPRVFNGLSGVLYLQDPETQTQARAAVWGRARGLWRTAEPSTCWAVRRGTTHTVRRDGALRCRHIGDVPGGSRCVPLMAHGQLVGLLVLIAFDEREDRFLDGLDGFAGNVADQIALAVSNVRLRDRLRQQSLRDQLTGLYNRRFFDDWLGKQISQVHRHGGKLSVAMLDIDHFKRFNDTHGHLTADRLLQAFSRVLERTIRAEDVVCRWGGEEFVLAMPDAGVDGAKRAIRRIQAAVSRIELADDSGCRIDPPTLSSGIATFPEHATDQDRLLHRADLALYDAKRSGRDRALSYGELSLLEGADDDGAEGETAEVA